MTRIKPGPILELLSVGCFDFWRQSRRNMAPKFCQGQEALLPLLLLFVVVNCLPTQRHRTEQSPIHSNHEDDAYKAHNLVTTMRQVLLSQPDVVHKLDQAIRTLAADPHQAQGGLKSEAWTCPDPGPVVCNFDVTGVPLTANSGVSVLGMLHDSVASILDDPTSCDPCVSTITTLQGLACDDRVTWEAFRDLLIPICEAAFEARGDDPVMCNGTITLQGPHVYCVLRETTARDFCESLNNCYPEDTREGRPPVSERTPWAVKAALEEQGWTPTLRPAGARRPSRDSLLMVAQLTDLHVQHAYKIGSMSECNAYVCCLEDSIGTAPAREYGEYNCNLPPKSRDLFLRRVERSKPDFVIYAGDTPPHNQWDESLTSQLNASQLVVDAMVKMFPDTLRVYPNIGNHEMFPTNLYSLRMPETLTMLDEFVTMYQPLAMFDDTAKQTMKELSYYTMTVPDHPKLRIVSFNTEYAWYTANFYSWLNSGTDENAAHKQWLNDTLSLAREQQEKVILIGHHPIGGGSVQVQASRWWEEIANEFADVILLHVSGHTHKDHFMMSFDPDTMEAKSVNNILTSTSARTDVNPTIRMFYLDLNNDYSLVDFENFYMDVQTQNQSRGVPPAIAFSYSAVEHYDMPDLSPNSWMELVLRFIDDDELFSKYYSNTHSHARDITCDYQCKVAEICSLWFPDLSEAAECRGLAPPEEILTNKTE